MIRWWAVYLAFLYAAAVTFNLILWKFAGVRDLWLIAADCGLGACAALCMHSLYRRTRKRMLR